MHPIADFISNNWNSFICLLLLLCAGYQTGQPVEDSKQIFWGCLAIVMVVIAFTLIPILNSLPVGLSGLHLVSH